MLFINKIIIQGLNMNVGLNTYQTASLTNPNQTYTNKNTKETSNESEKLTVEEQINKSAVAVSISMAAQIILLSMESEDKASANVNAQKSILYFLSGKEVSDDFKLSNTGYDGKPITELSQEEAEDLVSDDGFFGVTQTSQRVADFAINLSGNNLENLEASKEGIIKGFEDAKKMFGGELPKISYQTQTRTLELIDKKIAELKNIDE